MNFCCILFIAIVRKSYLGMARLMCDNLISLRQYLLPSNWSWNLSQIWKICKTGHFLRYHICSNGDSYEFSFTSYSSSENSIHTACINFVAELCVNSKNTFFFYVYQFCMAAHKISATDVDMKVWELLLTYWGFNHPTAMILPQKMPYFADFVFV